jgi:hypothetical protein
MTKTITDWAATAGGRDALVERWHKVLREQRPREAEVTREDLVMERDSVRVQISLDNDRGLNKTALEQRLAEIEGRLAARSFVEPMQFAALRKARKRKR